jgi:hypothetical protein
LARKSFSKKLGREKRKNDNIRMNLRDKDRRM